MTRRLPMEYSEEVRTAFPQLASAAVLLNLDECVDLETVDLEQWLGPARERLRTAPEAELESIKAWRAAFSMMGLKPTRYRCASEALLRRLRTVGDLPRVHPLVDLCNAISAASALPLAAFDLDWIIGTLTVRPATGTEAYETFTGGLEHPESGEIIFADDAGNAHARRWTHRQSARSAITPSTRRALVVCEGHHPAAAIDTLGAVTQLSGIAGGEPVSI